MAVLFLSRLAKVKFTGVLTECKANFSVRYPEHPNQNLKETAMVVCVIYPIPVTLEASAL